MRKTMTKKHENEIDDIEQRMSLMPDEDLYDPDDKLLVTLNNKLIKDWGIAIKNHEMILSKRDIRFIMDLFGSLQKSRIALQNQIRTMREFQEPSILTTTLWEHVAVIEKQCIKLIGLWCKTDVAASWAMNIHAIGPIIAGSLAAYIDLDIADTAGSVWAFCGIPPNRKWEKGTLRPYSARMKTLCFKIGDCFMKNQNNPKSWFGQKYKERKLYEIERNERGEHEELCKTEIAERKGMTKYQKTFYSKGRLPPGRLHLRAMRWTVKIFLSLWHEVAYEAYHGKKPPAPFVFTKCGHKDKIEPDEVY